MGLMRDLWRWRRDHPELPRVQGSVMGSCRWRKQCGDKIAYFTFDLALQGFYDLLAKPRMHDEGNAPLSIYVCPWCDWFHLGHMHQGWNDAVFVEMRKPDWA